MYQSHGRAPLGHVRISLSAPGIVKTRIPRGWHAVRSTLLIQGLLIPQGSLHREKKDKWRFITTDIARQRLYSNARQPTEFSLLPFQRRRMGTRADEMDEGFFSN